MNTKCKNISYAILFPPPWDSVSRGCMDSPIKLDVQGKINILFQFNTLVYDMIQMLKRLGKIKMEGRWFITFLVVMRYVHVRNSFLELNSMPLIVWNGFKEFSLASPDSSSTRNWNSIKSHFTSTLVVASHESNALILQRKHRTYKAKKKKGYVSASRA